MSVVVIPATGEALELAAPAHELARAWSDLEELDRDLKAAKREIADEVIRRLDHEGRRSMTIDGVKLEASAPTEKVWNLPELQGTLDELVNEGTISDEKAGRCIKWEPKPAWVELKTLLSDPRCKVRVEHCFTEVEVTRYAKVKI